MSSSPEFNDQEPSSNEGYEELVRRKLRKRRIRIGIGSGSTLILFVLWKPITSAITALSIVSGVVTICDSRSVNSDKSLVKFYCGFVMPTSTSQQNSSSAPKEQTNRPVLPNQNNQTNVISAALLTKEAQSELVAANSMLGYRSEVPKSYLYDVLRSEDARSLFNQLISSKKGMPAWIKGINAPKSDLSYRPGIIFVEKKKPYQMFSVCQTVNGNCFNDFIVVFETSDREYKDAWGMLTQHFMPSQFIGEPDASKMQWMLKYNDLASSEEEDKLELNTELRPIIDGDKIIFRQNVKRFVVGSFNQKNTMPYWLDSALVRDGIFVTGPAKIVRSGIKKSKTKGDKSQKTYDLASMCQQHSCSDNRISVLVDEYDNRYYFVLTEDGKDSFFGDPDFAEMRLLANTN